MTEENAVTNQLLTKEQAGTRLAVSTRTIDRLRREGRLVAVKVGGAVRFREADLTRFVEEQTR